jgi:hypothetical protein
MITTIALVLAGVLGAIVTWIVEGLFRREPPFGEAADYIIGFLASAGGFALDYYVLVPAFFGANAAEWLKLSAGLIEGPIFGWLVLWALRQALQTPLKSAQTDG